MSHEDSPETEYVCPGQKRPISKAVHLGRMAQFYPGCRTCRHRDDTASLSSKQVKRLRQARPSARTPSLFDGESAGGVYPNELTAHVAGQLAAAFGVYLRDEADPATTPPTVLLAGDGRSTVAEPLAAAAEALRWTGCNLIDIPSATAASLACGMNQLDADGGLLLGGAGDHREVVRMKFFGPDAIPLSADGPLETIERIFRRGTDRPARSYGSLRRFQADEPYLEEMSYHYHALRPLKVLLHSCSIPLRKQLHRLTEAVAPEIIDHRRTAGLFRSQVARLTEESAAHLAVMVGDDGETCQMFDQRGEAVPDRRLLMLIAGQLLQEQPGRAVVLQESIAPELAEPIIAAGGKTLTGGNSRLAIHQAMQRHEAILALGAGGRIWYESSNHHAADALMTITHLLKLLSRDDRPSSEVVSRARIA